MASVSRTFTRLAVSFARHAPRPAATTPTRPYPTSRACQCPRKQTARQFSVTPFRANEAPKDENASSDTQVLEAATGDDSVTKLEEFNEDDELDPKVVQEIEQDAAQIEKEFPIAFNEVGRKQRLGFWGMDEDDEDGHVEDDEVKDDAITSMAHAEMIEHREQREYARVIAWDMPSLANLAKPFTLPPETHLLRFRYTTYMGESHPAENKVVMELCSSDLTPTYLTEEQRLTLLKLVGTRYNPDKDLIKMSCEKFPSRAQNKRYLGDLINSLIKEAKEGDSFADIPLDLRHHKPKRRHEFPREWALTEERKAELERAREERKKKELERMTVVDGNEVIGEAMEKLAAPAPEPERVAVPLKGPRGKRR